MMLRFGVISAAFATAAGAVYHSDDGIELSIMRTLLYFSHHLVCYSEVPLINVDTITSNSLEPKFLELDSNSILN